MTEIFPIRLRAARLQAGLTQQQLAEGLGISKQSVSKYEHGKMLPDSRVLLKMSRLLGLKPDFFFRAFRVSLQQVDFRKRASLSGKRLEGLKAMIVDKLERYLELEEHLNLSIPFENPLADRVVSRGEEVEEAALDLLHQWDLGINPIPNVIEMLEDASVKVIEVEADGRFDGLSALVEQRIPLIVLNDGFDLLRKRFTALHELGHLLLNFPEDLDKKKKESLCNRFAGALLLPQPAALQELGKHRHRIALNELIPIKESYGISVQAIVYRASDLGIISPAVFRRFWQYVNQKPERKLEKGWGDYRGMERSSRFEQLLFQAVAEEIISLSKGAALANRSLDDFKKELKIVA
jgi:Zn-dependent peptidase ImmA (M78 family)/DNA-binding XRE family transcriptional regulator